MYVCLCNAVTETDIRNAATAGCASMAELTMRTGAGACCGSCVEMAVEVLDAHRPQATSGFEVLPLLPLVAQAA
ncbi:bacterioferritin [Luteimonas aestuarii]|uniref:Bacterioferritin-associated ferredoxin n=1 Tax=Luteimonas aestuarii TaxID=453837 RepID=A0A4R5TRD8_9GAMM|nr:bacterioferritin-associated ferredoxin [Luteimonas aestuarii]TDK19412.1 bacterioferritin [Luteimonas aestuarii]